jgi:Fur family transcriptional regulator, ferric uptake regulator
MRPAFSPLRERILAEIQKSKVPVNARDIHVKIGKKTAFSTIYRGLNFLEKNGRVEGFSLPCEPCGKDRFFIDASRGHVHYFHCEQCHSFMETGGCTVHIPDIERKLGVKISHHILVYSGTCNPCGKKI